MACSLLLISLLVVFVLVGENCFPFSTLGMFSYGYREQYAVRIGNRDMDRFIPMRSLGYTTSGFSGEIIVRRRNPADLQLFLEGLAQTAAASGHLDPEMNCLWLTKIKVEKNGLRHEEHSLIGRLLPVEIYEHAYA